MSVAGPVLVRSESPRLAGGPGGAGTGLPSSPPVLEYVVRREGRPWDARIFSSGEEVGTLRRVEDDTLVVSLGGRDSWFIRRKVRGQVRPFSLTVSDATGTVVLEVREHIFRNGHDWYMLTGTPEGLPLRELLLGRRYVCRIEGFPLSDISEVDHGTWSQVRRFRGVPVAEMEGLGVGGHRVRVSEELAAIALPLAVACYVLYSTA